MAKFCKRCGSPLELDSAFCSECGTQIAVPAAGEAEAARHGASGNVGKPERRCANCGALMSNEARFCRECGASAGPLNAADHTRPEEEIESNAVPLFSTSMTAASQPSFWSEYKLVIILVLAIAAVLGGWILIGNPSLRQELDAVFNVGKSSEQMASEISEMCRELERMQAAGQINYWQAFNFAATYNGYATLARMGSPEMRRYYEEALREFNKIKQSARAR